MGRELIMQDNTHGYTDFHDLTPSVDTGLDKPEVVKESYVVDYTTATRETLTMHEEGGFDYRWVYGLDRLSVKVTSEGTNWWGQNVKQDILKDYAHQDRMGSTTNLTDQFGRVVGRADYNEWGELTYKEELNITSAYRRIYPQASYTGHDWDDVLGMYYAKARFYDPAAKRFVAMDPIKGSVVEPLSLVPYIYCVDNPLRWVDPLGLMPPGLLNAIGQLYYIGFLTDQAVSALTLALNPFNIYQGFHEIAQLNLGKNLYQLGYLPTLEYQIGTKRADISNEINIWEVKPISYMGLSSPLTQLSGYLTESGQTAGFPIYEVNIPIIDNYYMGITAQASHPGIEYYYFYCVGCDDTKDRSAKSVEVKNVASKRVTTAWAAVVGILGLTLVEDFLTAGGGALDDPISIAAAAEAAKEILFAA